MNWLVSLLSAITPSLNKTKTHVYCTLESHSKGGDPIRLIKHSKTGSLFQSVTVLPPTNTSCVRITYAILYSL